MRVGGVCMDGFTVHQSTEVALPPTGLVLVTGHNGAGKSSLVEAVSWAVWGKTLRGAHPFTDGKLCQVVVQLADKVVTRKRKDKTVLEWSGAGYETTAKSQEALERLVGTHDVWRRTHVFSSADASHFTDATDGERKRLLESMLGLEKFDVALQACKEDANVASAKLNTTRMAISMLAGRVEEAEKRMMDAQSALDSMDIAEVQAGDLEGLLGDLQALQEFWNEHEDALIASKIKDGNNDAEMRAIRGRLDKPDVCVTCKRPWIEAEDASRQASMLLDRRRIEELGKLAREHAALRVDLDDKMVVLETQIEALKERTASLRADIKAAEKMKAVKDRAKVTLDAARRDVVEMHERAAALHVKETGQAQEATVLEVCTRVLGLKGVRAHVLAKALGGVEEAANAWLSRIAGQGLQLSLSPYTEKKTGGVSDAISLEVKGAGGGRGYKAASGGERRRIDVALMLALAEVSAAAQGVSPGTLFLDEVMDALDHDGQESVAAVLSDMASDRVVVVITHSEHLQSALRPAMHLHAEAGTYRRLR